MLLWSLKEPWLIHFILIQVLTTEKKIHIYSNNVLMRFLTHIFCSVLLSTVSLWVKRSLSVSWNYKCAENKGISTYRFTNVVLWFWTSFKIGVRKCYTFQTDARLKYHNEGTWVKSLMREWPGDLWVTQCRVGADLIHTYICKKYWSYIVDITTMTLYSCNGIITMTCFWP